jgi:ParB/Sulfiredoxin domain
LRGRDRFTGGKDATSTVGSTVTGPLHSSHAAHEEATIACVAFDPSLAGLFLKLRPMSTAFPRGIARLNRATLKEKFSVSRAAPLQCGRFALLPIMELKPDPSNPRKHGREQIRAIARSIAAFGLNAPILIDRNKQIVAGHGRYEAAKGAGREDVLDAERYDGRLRVERGANLIEDVARGVRRRREDHDDESCLADRLDDWGTPILTVANIAQRMPASSSR